MGTAITSPEMVCNLALAKLGYPKRIVDIRDGAYHSQVAMDVYAQTRDALLEEGQWEFAERIVAGALLKSAPPNGYSPSSPWSTKFPVIPWRYEYAFPSDCIKLRSVRPTPLGGYNMDPRFNTYSIDNDPTFQPPQRVILTNVQHAILTYCGRITDPTTWDAAFTNAFVDALCVVMGPKLAKLSNREALQDREASKDSAEKLIQ